LGWKSPVGRLVRTGVDEQGKVIEQTILGVVKDFNTYSLQHKISPMVMQMPAKPNDKDNLYVRICKNNVQASLDYITKVYADFDNENKPEFTSLIKTLRHSIKQNNARALYY
jgi:putative ABC transport system permease protein